MVRRVFLIGFMAAGKTTVGSRIAARLALPFIDLDDAIVGRAGRSVSQIFATDGEGEFRRLEAGRLAELAAGPAAVIATGGGAAVDPSNLATMRRSGLVMTLRSSLSTARSRARGAGGRPLLSRPEEEVEALYRVREPIYRRAHAVIDTDGRSVDEVAERVVELVARSAWIDVGSPGTELEFAL